ncbi:MAG: glycosyltransferase family 39 protein [Fimbriimonadales bacterium]|nr:glycosyltransferase family 39 protein [Fimbriimonadales bacterium]
MLGVLLGLAGVGVLTVVGGGVMRRLTANLLEQLALGGALALGLMAYCVAALAALGAARLWGAVTAWALTLVVLVGLRCTLGGALSWHEVRPRFAHPLDVLLTLGAWSLALLSLLLCALPPDGNEWDAIAYHLAFPKLYLQTGRMVEIPFMHQSYFPPLQDMLYLWGLLIGAEGAAKATHWAMGVLAALGAAGFVQRHGGSGAWAAILTLGVPAFLWQMFSAYADLATAVYASLAMFALAHAVSERKAGWLWVSGVLMGFALATKYTALLAWGLWGLIGLLWLWRTRLISWARAWTLAGLLALAIGSPWYLRNWFWTGNPVYPFAYEIFGGKNWSQAQADAYRSDQLKFGMGRAPAQLLLAPWNLAANPAPFADPIGARVGERVFLLPSLGVSALGLPSVWLTGGIAHGAGYLLGFVGLNLLGWFYLMQQIRYLLLVVPVLAGAGLSAIGRAALWVRYSYGALLMLQAGFTLWLMGSVYLPVLPLALQDRDAYLHRRLQIYPAVQFLNAQPDPNAGVILLDETRGYYLNRRYLWGNAGHHRLIPYETMRTGDDLAQWMAQHHYRYLLINRQFTPQGEPEPWRALYYDAIQRGRLQLVFAERGVEVYRLEGV